MSYLDEKIKLVVKTLQNLIFVLMRICVLNVTHYASNLSSRCLTHSLLTWPNLAKVTGQLLKVCAKAIWHGSGSCVCCV